MEILAIYQSLEQNVSSSHHPQIWYEGHPKVTEHNQVTSDSSRDTWIKLPTPYLSRLLVTVWESILTLLEDEPYLLEYAS